MVNLQFPCCVCRYRHLPSRRSTAHQWSLAVVNNHPPPAPTSHPPVVTPRPLTSLPLPAPTSHLPVVTPLTSHPLIVTPHPLTSLPLAAAPTSHPPPAAWAPLTRTRAGPEMRTRQSCRHSSREARLTACY